MNEKVKVIKVELKQEYGEEKLKTYYPEDVELDEYLATLIPITSPFALIKAPPLLPPLIAASVLSNFIVLLLSNVTSLSFALIIPDVTD